MQNLLRMYLLILIVFFLSACTSIHMTEEFQMGKSNFVNGNFKQAFHRLLPVAYAGRPEAQYAVGYMYFYGYGVALDYESGVFWISHAAECHYAPAVDALYLIHHQSASQCKTGC